MSAFPSDLKFVFGDFETFYGREFTLRKLDPPSYVMDPRFEAICLGVAEGFTAAPYLVEGPDIPKLLRDLGPNVAFVSHNTLFDGSILSWRYDYKPKLLIDTLALSRTLLSHRLKSLSLRSVAAHFGLVKDGEVLANVMDMDAAAIKAAGLWPQYTWYCLNDVSLCRAIFCHLAPQLPAEEFVLHDMMLRCATEPQFRIDAGLLQQNYEEVRANKDMLFARAMFAGLSHKDELMSNEQFADLLQRLGATVPRKVSPTTGRLTYAFSKSDPQFLALLEDEDPRVVALVEARLAFKTTIEETRTQRMINIANLDFPHLGTGVMPIPLKIGAAHTHRLGGDWKLNPQNWGRKSLIRKAVRAPEGYKVVAVDAEQIEARLNAWFCAQWDLVEQFARGEDVYSNFASQEVYHVPVDKKTEPSKRFVGKTGILQLGYQSGAQKFRDTVWLLSHATEPEPIALSAVEAQDIVNAYRRRFSNIAAMWNTLRDLIPRMHSLPDDLFYALGPTPDGPIKLGHNKLVGPNGLVMHYHDLQFDTSAGNWTYLYGGIRYKLYGGKLLENIIQFLARICVMQAAIRLKKPLLTYGSRLVHTAHDELVYLVPDQYVQAVGNLVKQEMSKTPDWAPRLPLSAAVGTGETYGDCK